MYTWNFSKEINLSMTTKIDPHYLPYGYSTGDPGRGLSVGQKLTLDLAISNERRSLQRERLIAKLAVIAGMRPGEIFGLTWGRLTATYADIRQRVYRGAIDTPKTDQSTRKAALSDGLRRELEAWREFSVSVQQDAWVFPSERLTPLSRDNCFRRSMFPKLEKVGLGWANFQVMRRTHATLMKALGVDGKLVAGQLGHSLDTNQNVYTSTPVESRLEAVNMLEKSLLVM